METPPSGEDRFHRLDYLKITALGFAFGGLANAMHAIILPIRVQDFAGDAQKSTFLGLLTFTGLLVAMLVQPVAGAVSDRSGFRWGQRKPFILAGIIAALLFLAGIGYAWSFLVLFIVWCLTQASLNTAQGPYQAYILDLVPQDKRGRTAGVKSLLEIAGGVVLLRVAGDLMVNYSLIRPEDAVWLWLSLGVLGLVLLAALLFTVLTVREKPGQAGLFLKPFSVIRESFRINVKADSRFVLFLVSRLLFIMALTTLQTFSLYYFQDAAGVPNPARMTADLITMVGIAMLIVVVPAGRLSDRIGRKPILVSCGPLAAAGIALIYLFPFHNLIIFSGVLIGIAAGAFLSTNWALAADLVPHEQAARYLGLTNLASAGGGALARLIGPVIDFFNTYGTGLGYSVMLGACFLYFLVSAILIWRIRTPGSNGPE